MMFDEELHVEKPYVSPLRESLSQIWVYAQDRWYKLMHCFCGRQKS